MKITNLRPLSSGGRDTTPAGDASIRGTDAQDLTVAAKPDRTRQKMIGIAAGCLVLVLVFGLLIRGWSSTEHTVSRERLRIATVTEGPFVRDVSAQGTVVAAVSPTLFAVAPGNISYAVRAGDTVKAGQVLGTLASPALDSEYQRERATLDSLDTALQAPGHRDPPAEARDQGSGRPRQRADPRRRARVPAREVGLRRGRDPGARPQGRRGRPRVGEAHVRQRDGNGGPRAGEPRPRPACAPDRARAPGLRGREPEAPRRRADRALAGRRHGREPRRGREGERRRERAAADRRRSLGLRGRVPGRRRLRARHQGRHGSRDLARRPRVQGPRHRHLAGSALRPGRSAA